MNYRKLGSTGIVVSEIGFGAWGIAGGSYGPVSDGESKKALQTAFEEGITFYDTADSYGSGHSEELIGKMCPFLLNLEPKKFMGHESHGMMLALDIAGDKSDCILLHPNKEIPSGLKVV